jgi:hypothetical protein
LDNPWTGYNSSLGRPLLNTTKFLEKKTARKDSTTPQDAPSIPIPGSEADSAQAEKVDLTATLFSDKA